MSARASQRVQRVPDSWPVVHLEASPPQWSSLEVTGHVLHPLVLSLDDLVAIGGRRHTVSLHCVWGWSKPGVEWDGVSMAAVLDLAGVHGSHVTVVAASDVYSACLAVDDAARGVLAWARDGEPMSVETGGPLRFVGPDSHWGYKGVKWASRVVVGDRFVPGFWESRIGDPAGRIPTEEVELP